MKIYIDFSIYKKKREEFEALREEIKILEKEAEMNSVSNYWTNKKYSD